MADEEEAGEEGKGGAVPWGLKKLAPGAAKVEAVRIPAAKRRVATLPAFLSLYGNGRANEIADAAPGCADRRSRATSYTRSRWGTRRRRRSSV